MTEQEKRIADLEAKVAAQEKTIEDSKKAFKKEQAKAASVDPTLVVVQHNGNSYKFTEKEWTAVDVDLTGTKTITAKDAAEDAEYIEKLVNSGSSLLAKL